MAVVRVNLYKLGAERKLGIERGTISLKNNVSLKSVEEMDFDKEGKKGLKFVFGFVCNYEPNLGKIEIEGQVFYIEEAKLVKEIKESWDKDKRLPTTVMEEVVNAALHKGNIQAIKIAEDIGLPSPLPLPKLAGRKKK